MTAAHPKKALTVRAKAALSTGSALHALETIRALGFAGVTSNSCTYALHAMTPSASATLVPKPLMNNG